jgi:hypothetical protein
MKVPYKAKWDECNLGWSSAVSDAVCRPAGKDKGPSWRKKFGGTNTREATSGSTPRLSGQWNTSRKDYKKMKNIRFEWFLDWIVIFCKAKFFISLQREMEKIGSRPGVGNLRPAGQIRPADHFYQAHFFRSMCVKNRHT